MGADGGAERFGVIIVGGGQAGLCVGYHLSRLGQHLVILDENERVGDAWRRRWDSLRLFTPAKYDGLPGMGFPGPRTSFPTKDEMADYLAAYAARFDLPVRQGVRVDGLWRDGDRYVVSAGPRRFEADHVVVATGASRAPKIPPIALDIDPGIVQVHSSEYRNPSQLRGGGVLVVGVGNSGAEIAHEVARTHPTWISGTPSGQIPFRHGPTSARLALPLVRLLGHHVLTVRTPIGRKLRPKLASQAAPLIRVKLKDLAAAGVEQVARTVAVSGGLPKLEDGRVLDVSNVIWCTGFRYDFDWIDLPVFDADGRPAHDRGIVGTEPGLSFVGLRFQFAESSDVLPGVGRDARHVARRIASAGRGRSEGERSPRVRFADRSASSTPA